MASKIDLCPQVASVAVHSKAVVLLLIYCCSQYLWVFYLVFCNAELTVLSSFAIISLRMRELVALFVFLLSFDYKCLFLAVPWVGLWSMIVAFPGHTHLLFERAPLWDDLGHCWSSEKFR